MQDIVNIVSTVGFPIAMCIYLEWSHKTTMEKMDETIVNNTIAIERLTAMVQELTKK